MMNEFTIPAHSRSAPTTYAGIALRPTLAAVHVPKSVPISQPASTRSIGGIGMDATYALTAFMSFMLRPGGGGSI